MQAGSFFSATGYMAAALVLIANAAAIVSGALDPAIASNGLAGSILLGAGILAGTYVAVGAARAAYAALWRSVQRRRGAMPWMLSGWTAALGASLLAAAAAGASVFERREGGVEAVLDRVSFFSFAAMLACFAAVAVATAFVWATRESPRLLEEEVRQRRRDGAS